MKTMEESRAFLVENGFIGDEPNVEPLVSLGTIGKDGEVSVRIATYKGSTLLEVARTDEPASDGKLYTWRWRPLFVLQDGEILDTFWDKDIHTLERVRPISI